MAEHRLGADGRWPDQVAYEARIARAVRAGGIANGHWVSIETPKGRGRARTRFNGHLDSRVAVGTPGYDPFGPMGANFNLLVDPAALDPVSGTASHRAYLCEIRPVACS
jgi:anaerobic selenocysteine-containing dehydrogenase